MNKTAETILTVGGLLAMYWILSKLFGTPKVVSEFRSVRVLSDPFLLDAMNALPNGVVPLKDLNETLDLSLSEDSDGLSGIQRLVKDYVEAPGLVEDNEERAVGVIQRLPNPYAVAYFTSTMMDEYRYTPAGYGSDFFEPRHMEQIIEHLRRIGAYPAPYGIPESK